MAAKNVVRAVIIILAVVVLAGSGFLAYVWFAGGTGEPTREVEAAPVVAADPESITYQVDGNQSQARFLIDEVLRGRPNRVTGVTNQIAGSIAIVFDPAAMDIGEFVINVRSIRTDDEIRDRTIRTLILESARDEYEFATFRPTAIANLPQTIAVGDTLDLQVSGDLTVRDVTTSTSFDMAITVRSEDQIFGLARTTITWAELEITIPYVGGNSIVASVAESLDLELEFVATKREGS